MKHILIVEDSPTMRALLVSALEELELPLKIREAESGFEALRALPHERYDLIVTDVNMPDINGLELVSYLRKDSSYSDTPLLIISTEGSDRDQQRGLELGADAYLAKPFEPETLRQLARDLLDRGGRGR